MIDIHSRTKRITVLPVYPKFPTTFWSFKHAIEFVGKRAIMPPTGLATVAAMLPQEHFDVLPVMDLNVREFDEDLMAGSDLVMTSTMIIQEKSHNQVIERAHALGKQVVGGGPFPTSYPERTAGRDYAVTGEAEITLLPFVEDFLAGKARRRYEERDIIREGRHNADHILSNDKTSIEYTPVPRWDLLDLKRYYMVPVQYSRGCPFRCEFCDITTLYGRLSRTKTAAQFLREFDALLAQGYRGPVFVVDDNFIGNRGKVKRDLLPALIEWQERHDRPFSFNTEASMNLAWDANREILEGMVEAGFHEVFVGIESPDEEVLARMAKDQNVKMHPLDAVKRIQEAGMTVSGGFIIGSDGEKPGVFTQMFDFIQEAGIGVPMPGLLAALKNTDLHRRLAAEGRLREDSQGDNTHHLRFNFEPELEEAFLIDGYVKLLDDLFQPKNYFARCRTLNGRRGRVKARRTLDVEEIKALAKSIKRQLFARGGLEYAKYLTESLWKRPAHWTEAIADAIMLYHFRTLTDETMKVHAYAGHAETLYQKFRAQVAEVSSTCAGRIHEGMKTLEDRASEVLQLARERCEQIHEDFRHDAEVTLDELRERILQEIEQLKA